MTAVGGGPRPPRRELPTPARGGSRAPAGGGIDAEDLRAYLRDALNEFRTPLTAVVEYASILEDGLAGALNAKQSEYTGYILEACRELLELYGDFRHSAGLRLGHATRAHEVFKLDYAIEESLAGLCTTRVTFRIDGCARPLSVYADRAAIVTTIARLAQRAAKCSTRGSEVVLRVRTVADARVEIAILDQGPRPTDNDTRLMNEGLVTSGVLSKSVTQVFGVGIELARRVLADHGSHLELSAPGDRGARAAFSLPIART